MTKCMIEGGDLVRWDGGEGVITCTNNGSGYEAFVLLEDYLHFLTPRVDSTLLHPAFPRIPDLFWTWLCFLLDSILAFLQNLLNKS